MLRNMASMGEKVLSIGAWHGGSKSKAVAASFSPLSPTGSQQGYRLLGLGGCRGWAKQYWTGGVGRGAWAPGMPQTCSRIPQLVSMSC